MKEQERKMECKQNVTNNSNNDNNSNNSNNNDDNKNNNNNSNNNSFEFSNIFVELQQVLQTMRECRLKAE